MKYLGMITADEDLTTKEYVDAGDAAFQAKRSQLVRPNLLDNWYFVGGGSQQGGGQFPINTRGQTSYAVSGYSIDRWALRIGGSGTSSSVVFQSDGLHYTTSGEGTNVYCGFNQRIEETPLLLGKKITFSALLKDVTVDNKSTSWYPCLFVAGATSAYLNSRMIMRSEQIQTFSGTRLFTCTGTVPNALQDGDMINVSVYTERTAFDGTIVAVKLELGDTQTLAHQEDGVWVLNEIPNYQEQLFRCQTSTADSADTYANKPNLVGFQVNPNLLDNWYFVGGGSQQGGGQFPINQRRNTSITNNNEGYFVDRWITRQNGATFSLETNGIKVAASSSTTFVALGQSIENGVTMLAGQTVTFSILVTENEATNPYIVIGNGGAASWVGTSYGQTFFSGTGLISTTVTLPASLTNAYLGIWIATSNNIVGHEGQIGDYLVISAAKLELGDTQTLAHMENGAWVLNEMPNYQKQLKRCQRFFIAFNHAGESYCKPGNGYAKSGTAGLVLVPHPTMRAAPSVTYSGNWAMKDYSNNYCTVSAMSRDVATAVGTSLNITSSSMTSGREYTLTANNDSTANIYLSADL